MSGTWAKLNQREPKIAWTKLKKNIFPWSLAKPLRWFWSYFPKRWCHLCRPVGLPASHFGWRGNCRRWGALALAPLHKPWGTPKSNLSRESMDWMMGKFTGKPHDLHGKIGLVSCNNFLKPIQSLNIFKLSWMLITNWIYEIFGRWDRGISLVPRSRKLFITIHEGKRRNPPHFTGHIGGLIMSLANMGPSSPKY